MKSKVYFLGIISSGIASISCLLNLKTISVIFAVISLIIMVSMLLKE